jgi:hypothetical protein
MFMRSCRGLIRAVSRGSLLRAAKNSALSLSPCGDVRWGGHFASAYDCVLTGIAM